MLFRGRGRRTGLARHIGTSRRIEHPQLNGNNFRRARTLERHVRSWLAGLYASLGALALWPIGRTAHTSSLRSQAMGTLQGVASAELP